MRSIALFLAPALLAVSAAQAQFRFDAEQVRWQLNNGRSEAVFQLTPTGTFEFQRFTSLGTGDSWSAPAGIRSSPVRLRVDNRWYRAQTPYRLLSQFVEEPPRGGTRQVIVLEDLPATAQLRIELEMYPDQPVLRSSVRFKNLLPSSVSVRVADMLPWNLAGPGETYLAFRVTQWLATWDPGQFQPVQTTLKPGGPAVSVPSGAGQRYCGWLAVRDDALSGLFFGWEFDGRANTTVSHIGAGNYLKLSSQVLDLNHPLQPNEEFQVPPAFLGLFHGDWDEAGYRTQSFAEAVVAKPAPDPGLFPYVGWDSWGYETQVDEKTLRRNAEIAARLGMELFIVDLGWARNMGDWYADSEKFPSGLRVISDYVHSLGMRFGLHFTPAEAHPDSPVLRAHPDWTSSETYGYHGAVSLCLSNRPTKEWLIEEAVRMIDDYQVDWILQDGAIMVKECTKTSHTHDPADSNYSNSVDGLTAVLAGIQQRRPRVHWENCENGGNMMTFNMLRYYVTSITNDASGSLGARRGVFGATYPFPPRYTDRYMPEESLDPYTTRSYMFGGPWLFMGRLAEMSPEDLEFAASEIRTYKALREQIRAAKILHLSAWPDEKRVEAIQSYDPATNSAVAFVTRHENPSASYLLRLRDLDPASTYQVSFEENPRVLTFTGAQLMSSGVTVRLPEARTAEIVYIQPLR
jgi:hypothetical protein